MNRAIVTGGTGYIGSRLVKRLVESGWDVGIVARNSSSLSYLNDFHGKFKVYYLDDRMDNLVDIIKNHKPDIVFHLAAHITNTESNVEIEKLIASNILFGTKLLHAMEINNVRLLINTGTYWQNYNNDDYNPVNLYAATKESFEQIIKYFVEVYNFKAITLKLFDVYGPCDKRGKLITSLGKYVDSSHSLALTEGDQIIDFIFIDDVIDAYIAGCTYLHNSFSKYKVFGIASGERYKLKEIIRICEELLNVKINVSYGSRPYSKREVMIPWKNYDTLPNWNPKITLRDGISRCYSINNLK